MNDEFLENAPITEALIDIKCTVSPLTNLNTLESYQENIKIEFPEKKKRQAWAGQINFKEDSIPEILSPSGGTHGFLFENPRENKIVQARLDGFTFNKLKPYSKWDDFVQEAKVLWNNYIDVASPINIERLGLRYINKIEIPESTFEISDYLLTGPVIANGISKNINDFFFRVIIPSDDNKYTATITQAIDKTIDVEGITNLIFDIDVFTNLRIDPKEEIIWEYFREMREFKNRIFFNSITESTRRLFE